MKKPYMTALVLSLTFLNVWFPFCQVSSKFSATHSKSGSGIFTFLEYSKREEIRLSAVMTTFPSSSVA